MQKSHAWHLHMRQWAVPPALLLAYDDKQTLQVIFDPSIDVKGRFMSCTGGWDWAPYSHDSQGDALTTAWLDARDVLVVETIGAGGLGDKGSSNVMGVDPIWSVTEDRVAAWWQVCLRNSAPCRSPAAGAE